MSVLLSLLFSIVIALLLQLTNDFFRQNSKERSLPLSCFDHIHRLFDWTERIQQWVFKKPIAAVYKGKTNRFICIHFLLLELFCIAHKLVDLYSDQAISWYAVGCYYDLIGKSDPARRYLSKATSIDRLFGPAWLAYGHSFAKENEHDQVSNWQFQSIPIDNFNWQFQYEWFE